MIGLTIRYDLIDSAKTSAPQAADSATNATPQLSVSIIMTRRKRGSSRSASNQPTCPAASRRMRARASW